MRFVPPWPLSRTTKAGPPPTPQSHQGDFESGPHLPASLPDARPPQLHLTPRVNAGTRSNQHHEARGKRCPPSTQCPPPIGLHSLDKPPQQLSPEGGKGIVLCAHLHSPVPRGARCRCLAPSRESSFPWAPWVLPEFCGMPTAGFANAGVRLVTGHTLQVVLSAMEGLLPALSETPVAVP